MTSGNWLFFQTRDIIDFGAFSGSNIQFFRISFLKGLEVTWLISITYVRNICIGHVPNRAQEHNLARKSTQKMTKQVFCADKTNKSSFVLRASNLQVLFLIKAGIVSTEELYWFPFLNKTWSILCDNSNPFAAAELWMLVERKPPEKY